MEWITGNAPATVTDAMKRTPPEPPPPPTVIDVALAKIATAISRDWTASAATYRTCVLKLADGNELTDRETKALGEALQTIERTTDDVRQDVAGVREHRAVTANEAQAIKERDALTAQQEKWNAREAELNRELVDIAQKRRHLGGLNAATGQYEARLRQLTAQHKWVLGPVLTAPPPKPGSRPIQVIRSSDRE